MKKVKVATNPVPITPDIHMEKLHIYLKYWQRELRLDGVEISVRWLSFEECSGEGGIGSSTVGAFFSFTSSHRFEIGIAPDSLRDFDSIGIFNTDDEVILVHELLHIVDCRWSENSDVEEVFQNEVTKYHHEIALDTVAEALVRSRRGIKR